MATKYGSTKLITVDTTTSASASAETRDDAPRSGANCDTQHVHLEVGGLRVKRVGRTVHIPNNIYLKTIFFIKQSRKYFEDYKLHYFIYFRGMLWTYIVIVCLSVFAATSSVYAIVNATYALFWMQHMFVVFTTLPLVLRQHVLSGTDSSSIYNRHFNISVEHYSADILERDGKRCGVLKTNTASCEFQAFSRAAISIMKSCRLFSIVSFTACLTLLVYCCACGIIRALKGHY